MLFIYNPQFPHSKHICTYSLLMAMIRRHHMNVGKSAVCRDLSHQIWIPGMDSCFSCADQVAQMGRSCGIMVVAVKHCVFLRLQAQAMGRSQVFQQDSGVWFSKGEERKCHCATSGQGKPPSYYTFHIYTTSHNLPWG